MRGKKKLNGKIKNANIHHYATMCRRTFKKKSYIQSSNKHIYFSFEIEILLLIWEFHLISNIHIACYYLIVLLIDPSLHSINIYSIHWLSEHLILRRCGRANEHASMLCMHGYVNLLNFILKIEWKKKTKDEEINENSERDKQLQVKVNMNIFTYPNCKWTRSPPL